MFQTIMIVHILALAIGIGGGAANGIIGARAQRADPEARPVLGGITRRIGQMSAGALALL
jgi:hypothetical protein